MAIVLHLHSRLTTTTCSSGPSSSEQCPYIHKIMHISGTGMEHCLSSSERLLIPAVAEIQEIQKLFHDLNKGGGGEPLYKRDGEH